MPYTSQANHGFPDGSGAREIPTREPPHTDSGSDDPRDDEDGELSHRTSEAGARDVVKDRGVQQPMADSDACPDHLDQGTTQA